MSQIAENKKSVFEESKRNLTIKRLKIDVPTIYPDFESFMNTNREKIYRGIIEIFNELKTTKRKSLSMSLFANINGFNWDTEFSFTKDEAIVLTRDLIPYFQEIEDYETCSEIITLYRHFVPE